MQKEHEEFFERNAQLGFEFSKYVLDNPEMDDVLADDAIVVFLPEYDPELKNFNLMVAKQIENEGGNPLYIKVKQMADKIPSRLIGVEVAREVKEMAQG